MKKLTIFGQKIKLFKFNFVKNEILIGKRPIKGDFMFFYFTMLKNELKIGLRPIEGDIMF